MIIETHKGNLPRETTLFEDEQTLHKEDHLTLDPLTLFKFVIYNLGS